ncbi:MAG: ABC transporter ATP-binding protein [Microbacteriaceae bacterium]|uniref:ABC transporter ATP-binding protein n=1 Tax=Brevibacterium sp. FAM 27836 TaxID=3446693 RepID=UPI003F512771
MIRKLMPILSPGDRARMRVFLALCVACGVLQGVVLILAVPALRHLLAGETDASWPWMLAVIGAALVAGVAFSLQSVLGSRIGLSLMRGLHRRIIDHLGVLPVGWFSEDRTGRLSQSVSQGTTAVWTAASTLIQPLVTAVATPVTIAVGLFVIDWLVGVLMLAGGLVLYLAYRWAASLAERSAAQTDAVAVEAAGRVVEFVRAQPVLRAFSAGQDGNGMLDRAHLDQQDASRSSLRTALPGLIGFATAVQVFFAAVIVVVVWQTLSGSVDAAAAAVVLFAAARFTGPLIDAADLGSALRLAGHDLDRINDLLDDEGQPEGTEVIERPGELAFQHVDFGYPTGRRVLHDISFEAHPGTTTALVGPSGSGKTTILGIAARFFDPDMGTVLVGGVDARELPIETVLSQVSTVQQNVYLLDDTLEANIRFGNPDATDDELQNAIRLARVDEILDRLPHGLDTRVGEAGAALSGGERQRVSIARAFLKDSPIVLLDEITASLDPENANAVRAGVDALAQGRTTLIVAHDLTTIAGADQILVLGDDGTITQRGTHAELIATPGKYADFWHERQHAQGWRITTPAPSHPERNHDASNT